MGKMMMKIVVKIPSLRIVMSHQKKRMKKKRIITQMLGLYWVGVPSQNHHTGQIRVPQMIPDMEVDTIAVIIAVAVVVVADMEQHQAVALVMILLHERHHLMHQQKRKMDLIISIHMLVST